MKIQRAVSVALVCSTSVLLSALVAGCGSRSSSGPGSENKSIPPAGKQVLPQTPSAFAGFYSGELVSNTGRNAGTLKLNLSDSNPAASEVIISGSIDATLKGLDVSGDSQSFTREIGVAGSQTRIVLKAARSGDTWNGELSTEASPTTYKFQLKPTMAPAVSNSNPKKIKLAPDGKYTGRFVYGAGQVRRATLTVSASNDAGLALLALFTPETEAKVSMVYSNGSAENLTNATWNSDKRALIAVGPGAADKRQQLSCVLDEMEDLECVLANGKSPGKVKFAHDPTVAPPQVAPVAGAPAPVAGPDSRTFYGVGRFTDSVSGKQSTRNVALTVLIKPSLSGGGTQEARVTFKIVESRVGAILKTATYDSTATTLAAEESLTMGTLAGKLVISCKNIVLNIAPYDFTCNYESTTTDVTGVLSLKGN